MAVPDPSSILDIARSRVHSEAEGVAAVAGQLDESFVHVVNLIEHMSGKVFITGSGTSGFLARRMAHILTVCGTPALYLQPMDALHGGMGAVTQGDILIAISRGGESAEINDLVKRRHEAGVAIVAITSAPASELARLSDVVVALHNLPGIDPDGVIAMGSTLVVGVWGDALAHVLMLRRGHSLEQVLHNHPAGAVGKLAAPCVGDRE